MEPADWARNINTMFTNCLMTSLLSNSQTKVHTCVPDNSVDRKRSGFSNKPHFQTCYWVVWGHCHKYVSPAVSYYFVGFKMQKKSFYITGMYFWLDFFLTQLDVLSVVYAHSHQTLKHLLIKSQNIDSKL